MTSEHTSAFCLLRQIQSVSLALSEQLQRSPPWCQGLEADSNQPLSDTEGLGGLHQSLCHDRPKGQALAVALDPGALDQVQRLNQLKSSLRACSGPKPAGWRRWSRAMVVLPAPPLSIVWFYRTSREARRRTLADVVRDLAHLAQSRPDLAEEAKAERVRLQTLDPVTPIALRGPVHSRLWYRARCLNGARAERVKGYAAEPVLFSRPSGSAFVPPQLSWSKPRPFHRAGHRSRISDERVTPLLDYFWYLKPKTLKKPSPAPRRRQNPHAKTAFPGLSLVVRESVAREPQVAILVTRSDGRKTQLLCVRRGFEATWQKAARVYAQGRALEEQQIVDAMPPKSQLDELIVWWSLKSFLD